MKTNPMKIQKRDLLINRKATKMPQAMSERAKYYDESWKKDYSFKWNSG